MSKPGLKRGGDSLAQPFLGVLPTVEAAPRPLSSAERKREHDKKSVEVAREEGREAGYTEGVQAGYEMGKLQGVAEGHREAVERHAASVAGVVDEFRDELMKAVEGVYVARRAMLVEAEEVLAGLAVDIAARVVAKQVEVDRSVAVSIAREAIREVTHATQARIRVNPFGSGVVRAYQDEIMAVAPTLRGVEIVDDSKMDGGVLIESEGGVIDARVRTRLAALAQAALESAPRTSSGLAAESADAVPIPSLRLDPATPAPAMDDEAAA